MCTLYMCSVLIIFTLTLINFDYADNYRVFDLG